MSGTDGSAAPQEGVPGQDGGDGTVYQPRRPNTPAQDPMRPLPPGQEPSTPATGDATVFEPARRPVDGFEPLPPGAGSQPGRDAQAGRGAPPNQPATSEDATVFEPRSPGSGTSGSGSASSNAAGRLDPVHPELVDVPAFNPYARPFRNESDRYQAPAPEQPRARTLPPLRKVLVGVALAVALAVLAGVIYLNVFARPDVDADTVVPASASAAAGASRPDELVATYLQALAQGDVDKALSFGPEPKGKNIAVITKGYGRSAQQYPITDIQVPKTDPTATRVAASYKVGQTAVSTTFAVRKLDTGAWQLDRSTDSFRLRATNAAKLPLRVNGVPVRWDEQIELLPGHYQVDTGLPYLQFASTDALVVRDLNYGKVSDQTLSPQLTPQGTQVFLQAVKTSLDRCLASHDPAPSGCPNRIEAPGSRATWSTTTDPLAGAQPQLSATDQADVQVGLTLKLKVELRRGTAISNDHPSPQVRATATMAVHEPGDVKVQWQRF